MFTKTEAYKTAAGGSFIFATTEMWYQTTELLNVVLKCWTAPLFLMLQFWFPSLTLWYFIYLYL